MAEPLQNYYPDEYRVKDYTEICPCFSPGPVTSSGFMRKGEMVLFLIILCLIPQCLRAQSLAQQNGDSIWYSFREKYPNPYQTIGFAQFNDNSQLYLIAEPPSDVNMADIMKVFDGFDASFAVKKWKIGFDGWVKDVIVTVNFIPAGYKASLISDLNNLIFKSSYKAVCLELSPDLIPRELFLKEKINYDITASSLHKWFVDDNMPFVELDNEKEVVLFNDLLSGAKNGVFMSQEPNFIAWVIPQNSDLAQCPDDIRRFTVDSDILLGAISNPDVLIVIGRERQASFTQLPPLRTEIIGMLAASTDKYLSQSLNIAELITGKMKNGADWCPAFLSDPLENNEYGHLLTMTDIFLKDWLSAGCLDYPEYNYPKPPFLYNLKDVEGKSIRFNWNTDNYLYSASIGGNNMISFKHTSCLNASLFDISEKEEQSLGSNFNKEANRYLQELNNADFARVVQYTALYQIFKANHIAFSAYRYPAVIDKSRLLLNDTRTNLNKLRYLSDAGITSISKKIAEDYYNMYLVQNFNLFMSDNHDQKMKIWKTRFDQSARDASVRQMISYEKFITCQKYQEAKSAALEQFERDFSNYVEDERKKVLSDFESKNNRKITSLRDKLAGITNYDFDLLCNYVAFPNGRYGSEYDRVRLLSQEVTKLYWPVWIHAGYFGIDMCMVRDKYVKTLEADTTQWMKTPKVVVTDNKAGRTQVAGDKFITIFGKVGGHSLTAEIKQEEVRPDEQAQALESVIQKYKYHQLQGNNDDAGQSREIEGTPRMSGNNSSPGEQQGNDEREHDDRNAQPDMDTQQYQTRSQGTFGGVNVIYTGPPVEKQAGNDALALTYKYARAAGRSSSAEDAYENLIRSNESMPGELFNNEERKDIVSQEGMWDHITLVLTRKHQENRSSGGLFYQEISRLKKETSNASTEISEALQSGWFVKKEKISALKATQTNLKEVEDIIERKPSFQLAASNQNTGRQTPIVQPSQEDQDLLAELQKKLKRAKDTLAMLKGQMPIQEIQKIKK